MHPQGGHKPGSGKSSGPPPQKGDVQMTEVSVGPARFTVTYPIFGGFDALPDDVIFTREPIQRFTRPDGDTQ